MFEFLIALALFYAYALVAIAIAIRFDLPIYTPEGERRGTGINN